MLKFLKDIEKKIKLILLYFGRIIFVRNKFKVSFFTKIKANLLGGYLADQYKLYDFKHNDKKEYLSEFDWYRSRYINEPFEFALNNKVIATEILKQYVKVPDIYFLKHKGVMTDNEGKLCDYNAILKLFYEEKKMFVKPFLAGKGVGVRQFILDNGQINMDGCVIDELEFVEQFRNTDDWMLCESINQADYLNSLYSFTTNTMRIITLRNTESKEWEIAFAVQRIGTKDTIPVDNGSRGGLVSKIDLSSGELSEGRSLHNLNIYVKHPNSNVQIEGMIIPNWEDIKAEVLNLSYKLPYMNFIAWDILVTKNGICVIEANSSSGVNIIQLWGGQRYGKLGEFYRAHGAIK